MKLFVREPLGRTQDATKAPKHNLSHSPADTTAGHISSFVSLCLGGKKRLLTGSKIKKISRCRNSGTWSLGVQAHTTARRQG